MNQRRLSIIGLVIAILSLNIIGAVAGSAPSNNTVLLDVEYFPQRHPRFCGEATAQMAINALLGDDPSQFRIRDEVPFNSGTRTIHMNIPFRNRGIAIIRDGILGNEAYLRTSVDEGYLSIILIRFHQGSNGCHYVLVTGYNATGFFIHDPWDEKFGELEGRETGAYAYINNQELNQLWAFKLFWVLTVAKQASNAPIIAASVGVFQ